MAFDPQSATAAYIDALGAEALAKSAAYTSGNHWILLWGVVVGMVVAWLIIRSGLLERITGDLSAKRGLDSGTANGAVGTMVVRGQAPMSELSGYQSRLNALTSGQGRYSIALSHYEAVPASAQAQLVAQYSVREDE